MLPSLLWAIWALIIPLSMAEGRVKWQDLMLATSEFPRFFGEVAEIERTGSPKVVAIRTKEGKTESMKCNWATPEVSWKAPGAYDCVFDCGSCATVTKEFLPAIALIETNFLPEWSNLTFLADRWRRWSKMIDGHETWIQTFSFNQTNLGGTIEIDNTFVSLNLPVNLEGDDVWTSPEPSLSQVYFGKFDNGSTDASCTKFAARDTAATHALGQPLWDALYPAKEYKLVYTAQDGQLYLTWRVTFDLKEDVGDDFVVWVNARNCSQIVAAAPAKLDLWTLNLEKYTDQLVQMFQERGLPIIKDPAA